MKQKEVYIEINAYGDKFYYSDREKTVLHREGGPAVECADGIKAWYVNGQRHRLDGPAVEHPDGAKFWYMNGQRHRLDGPAVELFGGDKYWWQNGLLHRVDGPAVEYVDGTKAWYIDGNELTKKEFLAETAAKVVHELSLDDIAARLGIPVESLKIVKEH